MRIPEKPFPCALMTTCLMDALRPQSLESCRLLLRQACQQSTSQSPSPDDIVVPAEQTCCGQPIYNLGDFDGARRQAERVLALFSRYDSIVVPSGSCAGMLKHHYPQLLKHNRSVRAFAAKVFELSEFLEPMRKPKPAPSRAKSASSIVCSIVWHDSCSCLRENAASATCARALLRASGYKILEAEGRQVCCGFGGSFSLVHSAISTRMADDKLRNLQTSGAQIVASADLGCLLQLAGRARRRALPLSFFHLADLLAADSIEPQPIGA